MEPPPKPSSASLFQVYLRLKPPTNLPASSANACALYPDLPQAERYLTVEQPATDGKVPHPTHITLTPPNDSRRRAVEKFAFTRVFQEDAGQLDIFKGTGVVPLIEGVLGADRTGGRDGLLATLGVTGSGKSHTILGSPSQRGLTQLALDVLFRALEGSLSDDNPSPSILSSLAVSDAAESHLTAASTFLDGIYGDVVSERAGSRAATPMLVGKTVPLHPSSMGLYPSLLGLSTGNSPRGKDLRDKHSLFNPSPITKTLAKLRFGTAKDGMTTPSQHRRHKPQRPSALPQIPNVNDVQLPVEEGMEFAVLVSLYEVYNDRIFDLLPTQPERLPSASKTGPYKDSRRRALLFKSTEQSPDRKVVAGLRKIICHNLEEALMVLETGLMERRVAGTGSNTTSSRSHGFFCVEVKRRSSLHAGPWRGTTLTIVDLAGSERARTAKTAGATLAEAGKINESLMYLGQCLQMQSDNNEGNKPALVPFRQCKLTELLFSNSFPSASTSSHHQTHVHRNPQKAVMIVTADPLGDFNATSQILRYSALAREVTVPRIPSITSTIFSGTTARSQLASGRTTPSSLPLEDVEFALQEVARLSEEVELLSFRLEEEEQRSNELEAAWRTAEERCLSIEQETRIECSVEMEKMIEAEARRWKGAFGEEADRNDEHMDKKLGILTQTIRIHSDPEPTESERIEEVERENERLQRKIGLLERELQGRSPTKKQRKMDSSLAPKNLNTVNGDAAAFDSHSVDSTEASHGRKTPKRSTRMDKAKLQSSLGPAQQTLRLEESSLESSEQTFQTCNSDISFPGTPTRKSKKDPGYSPRGDLMRVDSEIADSVMYMSNIMSEMTIQERGSNGTDLVTIAASTVSKAQSSPRKSQRKAPMANNMETDDAAVITDESTLRPASSAAKTPKTAGRKMRKLTTRKWDLGDETLSP